MRSRRRIESKLAGPQWFAQLAIDIKNLKHRMDNPKLVYFGDSINGAPDNYIQNPIFRYNDERASGYLIQGEGSWEYNQTVQRAGFGSLRYTHDTAVVGGSIAVAVNSGADDYYASPPSFFDAGGSVRIGGSAAVPQTAGVLFRDISIPAGAVIQTAFVRFIGHATDTRDGNDIIHLEDADDPTNPTSYSDVNSRVRTTASVTWVAASPVAGVQIDTPDFTAAMQEVVDRAGWMDGNNVHVLIDRVSGNNDVQLASYEGIYAPAELHVTYAIDGYAFLNGDPDVPELHPVVWEGDSLHFNLWARSGVTVPGTDPEMAIEFRDEDGIVLGTTTTTLTGLTTVFAQYSIATAIAPAGTSYVVFYVKCFTGGPDNAVLYVDCCRAGRN